MIVRDKVSGWNIEGCDETLPGALLRMASDADCYAIRCETTAKDAAIDALDLRRAAARYRQASEAIDAIESPAVGAPPAVSHKTDEQEGDDDGRHEHDFEVGSKG